MGVSTNTPEVACRSGAGANPGGEHTVQPLWCDRSSSQLRNSIDQLHRCDARDALSQLLRDCHAHRHHVGGGPRDLDLRRREGSSRWGDAEPAAPSKGRLGMAASRDHWSDSPACQAGSWPPNPRSPNPQPSLVARSNGAAVCYKPPQHVAAHPPWRWGRRAPPAPGRRRRCPPGKA